jgi:ribosomal protein S27E
MDVLARFPRVWCPSCNKTQPMIFDVMNANDKNDHDAADIICQDCKSIIATLHGPSAHRPGVRNKRAAKAREMASQEIERLSDTSATDEERQRRKRRLLKGPKEFRDIRAAKGIEVRCNWGKALSLLLTECRKKDLAP